MHVIAFEYGKILVISPTDERNDIYTIILIQLFHVFIMFSLYIKVK